MTKKRYQGETNDKERSMQRLMEAVGCVIKEKGYSGLGPTNIAKAAGLNKRLIYFYFGTVDNLIEQYVRSKDYFAGASNGANQLLEQNKASGTCKLLESLLINQLEHFYNNEEMQKIILWQISQKSQIMYEVAETREQLGAHFFELADKELDRAKVDLRAVAGLLVGGIYYMVLHAKSNDSLFCQIDVNTKEGIERIKSAISTILADTYRCAGLSNN
ncbi:TetR/AcrR family transcriptional regulator [Mucilaginibacter mali]|uniref:TetR/AcrR family transcriptional regulator n=1 Tax=Mucilaginibacter mali TaxID=2740462 RepID=A0A7D4UBR1_9SPHI|nr:TetR/AcrR family transcriptional regulator [Mucilaginibacter mali]QKJ28399.1 TetR/AcrR family transcriptional regulator [Mucilaginibacter mali]